MFKVFKVSSLGLRMTFLFLGNIVSGYIYVWETKPKLPMFFDFQNVLVECSELLKMTAQKRSLSGTSSQERTHFLILALRETSIWEQILLVTVCIPVPPLLRRQSSYTASWAVLSSSDSFAWEDWLWSYHSQDLTLYGWSHHAGWIQPCKSLHCSFSLSYSEYSNLWFLCFTHLDTWLVSLWECALA